jgi:3-oxoacyl-[acyl-carrier protein] reductase
MPLKQIEKGLASMCPLKRAGTTSDIAKAVALLVSPDSEWINGKESLLENSHTATNTFSLFAGQVIKLSGGSVA